MEDQHVGLEVRCESESCCAAHLGGPGVLGGSQGDCWDLRGKLGGILGASCDP